MHTEHAVSTYEEQKKLWGVTRPTRAILRARVISGQSTNTRIRDEMPGLPEIIGDCIHV